MHIEPGLVDGAKIVLSYGTAAAAGATALWHARETIRESGVASLALRSVAAGVLTFIFFEVLPHFAVGVSEVHLILGSTLFLLLGAGPSAIGLALGLLVQGMFFAPTDLPQFGMNMTTLLAPMFVMMVVAKRLIAPGTAYVDLAYAQVLQLSLVYQGGIVAWVAFWAFYGQGFAATTSVATFGLAYMTVVLLEPIVDLAVLAVAKTLRGQTPAALVSPRLYAAA
ncbi:energy-coupling factor ABC transporter permease [Gemmobacter denitrificans]|uniref:Energy-coupling factor ABC transporter permease n=1 Tax=Gemmobacter denitrificans TaxID=3123040 RepID=A0ABU8BTT2_9RHOB